MLSNTLMKLGVSVAPDSLSRKGMLDERLWGYNAIVLLDSPCSVIVS
jgi:hypothetical protein